MQSLVCSSVDLEEQHNILHLALKPTRISEKTERLSAVYMDSIGLRKTIEMTQEPWVMELVVFHYILRNSTGNSPESLASVLLVKSSEGSG